MADCIGEITEKYGLNKRQAGEVLRKAQALSDDPAERMEFAKQQAERINQSAQASQTRAQVRAKAVADGIDRVDRFKAAGEKPSEGIASYLVGSGRDVRDGRLSVDLGKIEGWKDTAGSLLRELNGIDKQAPKLLTDVRFGNEVAKAMWEIGNTDGYHYTPPDDYAFKDLVKPVAQLFDKYKETLRQQMNTTGADIGQLGGHVMPQVHDNFKLLAAGKENWMKAIGPLLDTDKTFAAGADINKVLGDVYDAITEGRWPGSPDSLPKDLVTNLGETRELHFSGPDEWLKYNNQFGKKQVATGIIDYMRRLSDRYETVSRIGDNPDGWLSEMMDHYKSDLAQEQNARGPIAKRLRPGIDQMLKSQVARVTEADTIPGNASMAKFMSNLRNLTNIQKLGRSVATQFNDVSVIAGQSQANGMSFLDSYAKPAQFAIEGKTNAELQEFGKSMSVLSDSILGHIAGRVSALDSDVGTMSKLSNVMMKFNGMQFWDDAWHAGQEYTFSNLLARESGKAFDFLDEDLQSNLLKYGIGGKEWAALRNTPLGEAAGHQFLSPEMVEDSALASKLRSYLAMESRLSLPLPGAREQAAMMQGTRPGTWQGEALRFIAQYKTVSYTMLSRVVPDAIRRGIPGSIAMGVGLLGFGYLSRVGRDLMDLKTPAFPNGDLKHDGALFGDALMRSGGGGIMADVLLGGLVDPWKKAADVFVPSGLSQLTDAINLAQQAIRGEKDTGGKALHYIANEVPFANLHFLRTAMNYLFMYSLQEAVNPGYLRRMERKAEQGGQSYMIPPTQALGQ